MKNTLWLLIVIIGIALNACGSTTPAVPTELGPIAKQQTAIVIVQTGMAMTQTASVPIATFTAMPTYTPIPPTETPTLSFTATNSPTAIPLNLFNPLNIVEPLRSSPNGYSGTYIKALASNAKDVFSGSTDAPSNPYWLAPADYTPLGIYVNTQKDPTADNTVDELKTSKWVWIYGVLIETKNKYPSVSVIHVEQIQKDQTPRGDGVYKVGTDFAPGRWKSISDATQTQSCYWARVSSDGSIIDNFFGYGGTTIYVNASDFAVEIKDCSLMVYLGP